MTPMDASCGIAILAGNRIYGVSLIHGGVVLRNTLAAFQYVEEEMARTLT